MRDRSQSGQALVESAIVFPLAIFFVLGTLQLTLIQQSRLMLEYAAFNAARAGAVWNGDPEKMEDAAIISLLPTMPSVPGDLTPLRVDEPMLLLARWGTVKLGNMVGGALNAKMIEVETLNPTPADFQDDQQEIEFDMVDPGLDGTSSLDDRRPSQLTIRLTYYYYLRLPIINKFMFETWLAGMAGLGMRSLDPFRPKLGGPFGGAGLTTRMGIEALQAKTNCQFSGVTRTTLLALIAIGKATGKYYMPLVTTYTIRMQSNFFRKFARQPKSC